MGRKLKIGLLRELNPGPPAPKAGIMPLDQTATVIGLYVNAVFKYSIEISPQTLSISSNMP
jgi:hypothetical protein